MLWTNHFSLDLKGRTLYRYSINFNTSIIDSKPRVRTRLVQQLLKSSRLQNQQAATDFKQFLYSPAKLPENVLKGQAFPCLLENEVAPTATTTRQYNLELEGPQSVHLDQLCDFLDLTNVDRPGQNKEEYLQALNIIMGHYPKALSFHPQPGIVTAGARKHALLETGKQIKGLPPALVSHRGYQMSARLAASRVLLNVQVKHIAIYTAQPLWKIIDQWKVKISFKYGSQTATEKLERFLLHLRVESKYAKQKLAKPNQRIVQSRTINGLASPSDGQGQPHPPRVPYLGANAYEVEFYLSETQAHLSVGYCTVTEYFRAVYVVEYVYENYPVINVGPQHKPVYNSRHL